MGVELREQNCEPALKTEVDESKAPLPRGVRLFLAARLAAAFGIQLQVVAIGWQIYARTGDPMSLGWVGLVQFLPMFLLSLPAGVLADRFDRRLIIVASRGAYVLGAISLALWSVSDLPLGVVYAILAGMGVARAFASPATSALLPQLSPSAALSRAIALSSGLFQFAVIVGPAVGGALYALAGPAVTYLGAAALELSSVGLFYLTRPAQAPTAAALSKEPAGKRVVEGLRFVWSRPILLGAISLDLFAVLLGGAVALMPIYARDILHVGEIGLGTLRSAPAVGAAAVAAVLAFRPLGRRTGAWMLACVAIFGAATVVFGLSTSLPVSLAALAVLGAADMVSMVVRQSLVQLHTPDDMRGRVSSVNMVFISASNELGELESGVTAALWGPVTAVVVGGVGTIIVVVVWALLFPGLRRVDRLTTAVG